MTCSSTRSRRSRVHPKLQIAFVAALFSGSVFAAHKRVTVGIDVSLTGAGAEDAILVKNGAMLALSEAHCGGGTFFAALTVDGPPRRLAPKTV